jgi:cytochrome c553
VSFALKLAAVLLAVAVWPFQAIARRFSRRSPAASAIHKEPARQSRLWEWLLISAMLFGVLGILGFLAVVSGIIPIKASSGHWPVTAWFLEFSMERSVATHSVGITVPALGERQARRAAGHYETGCRPCHGSPEIPDPRVVRIMTPPPPYLAPVLSEWKPNELFYIVKHGVKFTGMPGWPAQQRDDEVWAMVAFLLELPNLGAADYRRMVHGGLASRNELFGTSNENCERCHGVQGSGIRAGETPKLAGQREAYLSAALRAFARGQRHSGIMEPVAVELDDQEIEQLAAHYSALLPPDPANTVEAEDISRGREIAQRGIPAQRVPACADCHGPGSTPRNPAYPELAGQYADYLVLQLELFKARRRGGSQYGHLMHQVAPRLNESQMRDVALYYESLNPSPSEPER